MMAANVLWCPLLVVRPALLTRVVMSLCASLPNQRTLLHHSATIASLCHYCITLPLLHHSATIASLCPHYFQTKTAIGCNLLKTGQTAVRARISAIFFPILRSSYCLTHRAGKDPEIGPDSSYPPWVFALADPAPTRQVLFLPTLRASAIHC
jgi:hypothetical protein